MDTYQPLSPNSHVQTPDQPRNVFRPRRSDDWHEYREIIEQLYRNDQLKLRDVKRIMERDYKFVASYYYPPILLVAFGVNSPTLPASPNHPKSIREKQYKDRLAAWHVRKNIKAKEVHLMLRKQQKRAAQGKQTAFRVNGQNVDPKRIARFVRRYGTSWDSTRGKEPSKERQSPEPQTPSDMTCYTPEPAEENNVTTPISPLEMHSPREMPPYPLNPYGKSTDSMSVHVPDIDGRYLTLDPNHLENLPDLIIDEDPNMPLTMHSNRHPYHSIGNHVGHGHAHGHPGPAPRDLDAPGEVDNHPPDWNTVESFQTRLQGLDYTLSQTMSKWARDQDPNQEIAHHEGLGM